MKTIVLHGEMADKFCDKISLNARNIHDVINGLTSNFPSFKTYLINQSLIGVNYKLIDEDYTVYDGFCSNFILRKPLYHIVASPQGNSGGGFLGGLGGMGMNALMGYGMQKLSNALNPSEDNETPEYEIIQTNSYLYESNENVIEQGAPVPVVYGQLRVGTKVISSSVHNYDMDFKKSEIFYFNKNTTLDSINGTPAWSFYRPLTRQDDYRRNGITDEAIKTYSTSDSTKYKVKFGGGKNSKVPNPSAGSSPLNDDVSTGGNGRSTITYGPSVRSALTEDDGGTTVGGGKETRPFVFPPSSATDGAMRPQGKNENCGVIKYSNGTTEIISYKSTASPMTVGGRGNFTKLESVALFSSLEIVSEGPIAGLALPMGDESTFDNGSVTFPLGAEIVTEYAGEVQFNEVKFSSSKNLLVDENTNSEVITIVEEGSINYLGGGSATATVKANAGPQSVGNHTFNITVDSPAGSVNADAGNMDIDITSTVKFYNNQQDTRTFYPSTNKLFLYEVGAGEIYPNSNQLSSIPHYLDTNYIEIDRSNPDTAVFNIEALSNADLGDGLFFEQGEGYQKKQYDIEVHPINGCPDFQFSLGQGDTPIRANPTDQPAEPLDMNAALGEGTTITDSDMVDSIIEKLNDSSSGNIPRTTTSQAKMARIFAEHNCPAFASRCTNNNAWAYVAVGRVHWNKTSVTWTEGFRFNSCSSNTVFQNETNTTTLYLKVFLSEYISLSNIDAGAVSSQVSSSARWFGLNSSGNMVSVNSSRPAETTQFNCWNGGTNVTYSFSRAEATYETDLEESGANGIGARSVVFYMQNLINGESVNLGKLILSAKNGSTLWGDVLWDAFRGNQAWSTINDSGNSVSSARFDILKNVSFLNRSPRSFKYFDVTVGDFVVGNSVKYPKFFSFIPGSGGTSSPNIKVRSGSQFSKYITEELNANLSNVNWSKSAENQNSKEIALEREDQTPLALQDTSSSSFGAEKRGFYNPLLFPRCQVFVLRKSQRFGGQANYSYCPTKFNVVVNIKGNGMVDGLHLLDMNGYLPDNQRAHKNASEPPVWDPILNAWTDIFPQDLNHTRPFQYYSDGGLEPTNYQDVGITIVVPNADGIFEAKFEVNEDGTINEEFEDDSEVYNLLIGLPDSWSSFQKNAIYTTPGSFTNLCHLTPDINSYNLISNNGECVRRYYIKDADSHIAVPTSVDDLAVAVVDIERLTLQRSLTQGVSNTAINTIVTGRPTKISIDKAGKNYIDTRAIAVSSRAKLMFSNGRGYGYVDQFEPIDPDGASGGYKPNCQFYAYAISKSLIQAIFNRNGSVYEAATYFNVKLLLSTNDTGQLSSSQIIDPGTGFTEAFEGQTLYSNVFISFLTS
jgi:predicted phage tail protein